MTMRVASRKIWALALIVGLLGAAAVAPLADAKKKTKKGPGRVDITQPVNAAIPDRPSATEAFGQLISTIAVGNQFRGKLIRDVNVTLQTTGATGASPADNLIAKLTAPNGATTRPIQGLQGVSIGPLTLDDQSPLSLGGLTPLDPTTLSAPYIGSAQPGLAATVPLAVMNGGPVAGTWTLRVLDAGAAGNETSVLNSWRLNVVAGKPFLTK